MISNVHTLTAGVTHAGRGVLLKQTPDKAELHLARVAGEVLAGATGWRSCVRSCGGSLDM